MAPTTCIAVVKAGFQSAHSAAEPRPLRAVSSLPENPPSGSIHLLVFDEMDNGYLYEEGKVRPSYPNFREFSSAADNFHQARAPAGGPVASATSGASASLTPADAGIKLRWPCPA